MHPIHRRSRRGQALVLLSCLSLTAYHVHHVVYGRHGLEARQRLIERSQLLEFEMRSLETVRARLARDVALLSPDQPNRDFVDEIARETLGFAHPSDNILTRPAR